MVSFGRWAGTAIADPQAPGRSNSRFRVLVAAVASGGRWPHYRDRVVFSRFGPDYLSTNTGQPHIIGLDQVSTEPPPGRVAISPGTQALKDRPEGTPGRLNPQAQDMWMGYPRSS